eukprot:comp22422_c0_seq4/m.54833 comp22422_c0_seq4/g.54833  ORF comp22422_c0_seq4/g.54833 comp22422_c0_seq4/m.54833 type:complete len:312 (+) comp22422_c0_seq4:224-1159(+)
MQRKHAPNLDLVWMIVRALLRLFDILAHTLELVGLRIHIANLALKRMVLLVDIRRREHILLGLGLLGRLLGRLGLALLFLLERILLAKLHHILERLKQLLLQLENLVIVQQRRNIAPKAVRNRSPVLGRRTRKLGTARLALAIDLLGILQQLLALEHLLDRKHTQRSLDTFVGELELQLGRQRILRLREQILNKTQHFLMDRLAVLCLHHNLFLFFFLLLVVVCFFVILVGIIIVRGIVLARIIIVDIFLERDQRVRARHIDKLRAIRPLVLGLVLELGRKVLFGNIKRHRPFQAVLAGLANTAPAVPADE